jgi:hypothetical protein
MRSRPERAAFDNDAHRRVHGDPTLPMHTLPIRFALALSAACCSFVLPAVAVQAQSSEDGDACLRARQLWFDDFETGDHTRWTSNSYVSALNKSGCSHSGFGTDIVNGGEQAHVTSIACRAGSNHRVYGGLQFSGDEVVPRFTNTGTGIDAPHGIVVTFSSWLDAPGFGDGRWMSLFTANNSCDHSDRVVTFGLEDATNQTTPAHVLQTGGTLEYDSERAPFPLRQWTRTTIYLNYHDGEFHVWQDGVSQMHGTFRRSSKQICQLHWGLYASGNNHAIKLVEDDMSVWKLEQPLEDFVNEPWLGEAVNVCD